MASHTTHPGLDAALVAQTVPEGSLRYYTLLYAPASARDQLVALYLLQDELAATGRSAHHEVAHTRLAWWSDEIDRLIRGTPAHPATRALQPTAASWGAETAKLRGIVEGAAMDLARITYADEAELSIYLDRTGGTLAEFFARCLRHATACDPQMLANAARLGSLLRRVETLRDIRADVTGGRVYFPLAELDAAGIDVAGLRADPWPPEVQEHVRTLAQAAASQLESCIGAFQPGDRASLRPLLVSATLHQRLLERVRQNVSRAAGPVIEVGPFEKLFVSWRAARKAR